MKQNMCANNKKEIENLKKEIEKLNRKIKKQRWWNVWLSWKK